MSQSTQQDLIGLQLKREEHRQAWREARDRLAEDRGVDADKLSRPEVAAALARHYVDHSDFRRLREDKRLAEVREAIANDHGMAADEISFEAAVLKAGACYNGFAMVDDWEVSPDA